jgi:hypothetical protein
MIYQQTRLQKFVPELTLETLVTPKPVDTTSTSEVRNSTPGFSQPVNSSVVKSETKAEVEPSQIADDSIKEVTSQQDLPLTIISARAKREERLRKKVIALGMNPDKFVTIIDEDKRNSVSFRYKMEAMHECVVMQKGKMKTHMNIWI